MLSVAQQSAAVLGFIKGRLGKDIDNNHFLRDPFFLANLDYNFETLFTIYTGAFAYHTACWTCMLIARKQQNSTDIVMSAWRAWSR